MEDLVMDIIRLQKDLNVLGYNMLYIQDFLKKTETLEVGAQIQKLRKHIERMTKLKDENAPSNSTSALVSTLAASSVGAAQKVVKKRGRVPNSSAIVPATPKSNYITDFLTPIRQFSHGGKTYDFSARYKCLQYWRD